MRLFRFMKLFFIINLLVICSVKGDEVPFIFNYTESAEPGETIGLQGYGFCEKSKIWYALLNNEGTEVKPSKELMALTQSDIYIAVQIPEGEQTGIYAIWVVNNDIWSPPVFINKARVKTAEFDEIMPGCRFRVFGSNMKIGDFNPMARLVDKFGVSYNVTMKSVDDNIAELTTPENLKVGESYKLYVNNGAGGKMGESVFEESIFVREKKDDLLRLEVPWGGDFDFAKNVYNVKTDKRLQLKAMGDGVTNDQKAIQMAIDMAASQGGGVVYLPAGSYKIEYESGCGILMQSRVVLRGAGKEKTIIKYGYGKPFSTERVKGKYGWPLGWPDCRLEGMGLVFPGFISTCGLSDLSFVNVNECGHFLHTVKNMPEGGEKVFVKNCYFDFSNGWGLTLVNIDKLLVSNSDFKSITVDVRGINAPTRTWPWDFKNSYNMVVRDNHYFYNAGRFGVNGCHHALFENNVFVRNGDYQAKGETGGLNMDYVTDMIILNNSFLVKGHPILARNQGETILSQGGDPNQMTLGTVSEATAITIKDSKQEWQDFTDRVSTAWQYAVHPTNYMIAIVSGKGAGQWRTIIHNNDTVLTVDRPWDVIPDKGSHYIINQWSAYQLLVKDNVLKDNHQGIMMYCGGNDIAIVGNKLTNSSGIYLRADQRMAKKRYNLLWNTVVSGNQCVDTDGRRAAFVSLLLAVEKDQDLFGIGTLGLVVRRNTVKAYIPNVTSSPIKAEGFLNYMGEQAAGNSKVGVNVPGILGSIWEYNNAINTDNAFIIGKGTHHVIIKKNQMENVSNPILDLIDEKQKIGAKYIVTDIK